MHICDRDKAFAYLEHFNESWEELSKPVDLEVKELRSLTSYEYDNYRDNLIGTLYSKKYSMCDLDLY